MKLRFAGTIAMAIAVGGSGFTDMNDKTAIGSGSCGALALSQPFRWANTGMLDALAEVDRIQENMQHTTDDGLTYLREGRAGAMYDTAPRE